MKLVSWNVNSLRSCEEKFLKFIAEHSPDVIAIQELRAHEDQLSFFLKSIAGYSYVFNDSGRPGYGGTALYYRNSLSVSDVSKRIGHELLDSEGRVISMKIGDVTFLNFYVPNGNSSESRLAFKLRYYAEIYEYIKTLKSKNDKIVIGGDFNVAHTALDLYLKYCNHSGYLPEEKAWFENMLQLGFFDSFRHFYKDERAYSWWHMRDRTREQNNGWRFDYFLVANSLKEKTKSAGMFKNVYGSDHCPIWVEVAE